MMFSFSKASSQGKVFALLEDKQWHCREHEGKLIASGQYAGGGGIQGLQRGTKSRCGLVIETQSKFCSVCNKKTIRDRWTGNTQSANASATMPKKLIERILVEYDYIDVIEQRKRAKHELVIDHRFPMERWGQIEPTHSIAMTNLQIHAKFQLLKKDSSGNHNLLKSRACEKCISTGKRGTPFGISYWYQGGQNWNAIIEKGADAEQGCIGCGWYDFSKWRLSLNQKLTAVLLDVVTEEVSNTD